MKNTLILGGGIGGIVASNILKNAAGDSMQVTVVDREVNHYFAAAYPLLMIGQREPTDITRKLTNLKKKNIHVLHQEVQKIDLTGHQVSTNQGVLPFDYLIISLGVEYHTETVPGFKEYALNAYDFDGVRKINQQLNNFSSGRIVFFISSLPYKCPPAPYEIMFLLDQFFRKRGIRNKIELILVTPDYSPEPLAKPKVGQSVRKMLAEKGIELITEAKVIRIEEKALILDHGTKIAADLLLGIAPHWTPEVLRKSNLVDSSGFVQVDLHTLETNYPTIYAIGDAAAVKLPVMGAYAPKAGTFAHYQADVVARNIYLLSRGVKPEHTYKGKGT
ncbi:pyridine nucleotide-disulfide oxidoreductase [Dehalobacter restrictus]|uniref:Pyridine nucleotide-disulfide oxidoreductase n=2 Tax=Dehalobacter restrictus TaxID=55583 RepID=A0A857DIJ8_9FIRM|nr:FAD-dependent oxidoreductase [Dehalobacter restrictus]QHA00165.1 pyridine nucleotide-disulfide oxidoreductase [Dehalobacter restrictus]